MENNNGLVKALIKNSVVGVVIAAINYFFFEYIGFINYSINKWEHNDGNFIYHFQP